MNLPVRVHSSARLVRSSFCCVSLLTASALFAADAPVVPLQHHLRLSASASRPAMTARLALFEKNDIPRAARLAQLEIERSPQNVDGWFLAMETASLLREPRTELKSSLAVCRMAEPGDPRLTIAKMRLAALGDETENIRAERASLDRLAAGDSACSTAAGEALYTASLNGLAGTDVRDLARRAGWLTKWTVTRRATPTTKFVAEEFEFPDGRILLPDYLPQTATYSAESDFTSASTGDYSISGDLAGAKIAVDGNEISTKSMPLTAGTHRVQVTFRAAVATPRIHIALLKSSDDAQWTKLHLPRLEAIYVRAAAAFATDHPAEAADLVRQSELASTAIGQQLLVAPAKNLPARYPSTLCATPHACGPDSLVHAETLANTRHHREAIAELSRVLHEWPLKREAHRMMIAELQRVGNNPAADRAAAEFLRIAPNARYFRRMAQNAIDAADDNLAAPFYQPYRRPAPAAIPITSEAVAPVMILLQDKVAIARLDGSVSLYTHRVVQLMNSDGARDFQPLALPDSGQLLALRLVNNDQPLPATFRAGDEIEEEFVVNYTGDGGMIAHPEAFQYVFNDFDSPLLNARFVVLSPASQSPGYVIASGVAPVATTNFVDGLCAQTWERTLTAAQAAASDPAIVRVVENENGWSIPPSIERRRILETIHPGPRNREA